MTNRNTNREREVVVLAGGESDLTFEGISAQCEERVAELLAETCHWRLNGVGRPWKPGDFNILIFETTVGPGAELFVQFWSEPKEPVAWEVCSGQLNPAVRALIDDQAREKLRAFGFELREDSPNFRKVATIANIGDVRAAARQTLRIFVEALGYRGRTPLVARLSICTRAERQWAYTSLTPEDVQKMFWRAGCRASKAEGTDVPVLNVEHDGMKYNAIMYARLGEKNLYECVDLRVFLGRARRDDLVRLNGINTGYRAIKAWLDDDGEAWLVQSIGTRGGLTEAAFRVLVEQFERALHEKPIAQIAKSLESEADEATPEADAEEDDHPTAEVVH